MKSKKIISEVSGIRIDGFLAEKLKDISRSHIQKLINEGKVLVNDKEVKTNYKVKVGDIIIINIPEVKKPSIEAEEIELDILYEDDDIIVVNKPQGMVVHPAAGNYTGTLVNALLNHCDSLSGVNGPIRPGIVHRIDKDTSGVIVAAKNDFSHIELAKQIKKHTMTRRYIAIVEGVIKVDDGIIEGAIGRNPKDRKKMDIVSGGRYAKTYFKVLDRFKSNTLIEAKLDTGRTHQIRVHMAHIGHPVVGDSVYGYKKQKFNLKGQALHAAILGFIHPRSGQYMEFKAPLPPYFEELIDILKQTMF
jgi:23S rRNA pseudouridine1911/1915/1917 synthase